MKAGMGFLVWVAPTTAEATINAAEAKRKIHIRHASICFSYETRSQIARIRCVRTPEIVLGSRYRATHQPACGLKTHRRVGRCSGSEACRARKARWCAHQGW